MRIIVADDMPMQMREIAEGIRAVWPDWEILTATDGQEILRMVSAQKVDIVLSDLSLIHILYAQAKALDGTRLVSSNDGWEVPKTDIFGLHDYAAWGDVLAKHFESRERFEKISCDHHMARAEGTESTCLLYTSRCV